MAELPPEKDVVALYRRESFAAAPVIGVAIVWAHQRKTRDRIATVVRACARMQRLTALRNWTSTNPFTAALALSVRVDRQ